MRSTPLPDALPPSEQSADESAQFDDLYRTEWRALVALGWSLTGSWTAAEELVQDAFADAYRRWPEVGAMDKPGAWVRRALLNRSASLHRRRATERAHDVRTSTGPEPTAPDPADAEPPDPAFWAAVRSLPHHQRAAVALHYLEDRSIEETAELIGCRPATVRVHLHRARRALAAQLGPSNAQEEGR